MEVAAKLKGARKLSAQKARLVADQIRGKSVDEALDILAFSPRKGADHEESAGVCNCKRRAQRRCRC